MNRTGGERLTTCLNESRQRDRTFSGKPILRRDKPEDNLAVTLTILRSSKLILHYTEEGGVWGSAPVS
jgi:hypothetical protein